MAKGFTVYRGQKAIEEDASLLLNDSVFEILDIKFSSVAYVEENFPQVEPMVLVYWNERNIE